LLIKFPQPILDDEICIKHYVVELNSLEEDSFRYNLSNLLLSIAYTFIELRHFTTAIGCLNECISLNDNNLCDSFFRRSQCHLYNKNSKNEQLYQAIIDIKKALKINSKNRIYRQNLDLLNKTIEKRNNREIDRIKGKINFLIQIYFGNFNRIFN